MYLLDTTVWIDLLRTNSQSIRGKLSEHSKSVIGLSVTKLCTTPPALYQEVSRAISCLLYPEVVGATTVLLVPNHKK